MRTSLLINLLFLLGLSFIQAQEVNSSVIDSSKSFVVENHSIRANIVKPMLAYQFERPIFLNGVFELQAGLTMGGLSRFHALPIGDKDRWNQYHKTSVLMPTWSLAVKKYYGFKVRSRDGLSIKRNSANFIALRYLGLMSGWTFDVRQGDYIAKEKTYFDKGIATGFAATWGINRDIGKEFSFNYEMGPISMKAPEGNWGLGLYIKVGFSKNL
ncbi:MULTISPECIES: hypothetical protein [Sphingobacterium]|uniref:DUF3575 domain-containing protein n=1 Tax=Sphingobacterium cellulitidis TaxID=1768011 RepID=A0A8H9G5M8_9SPHI|nr:MULTISPECIES: hypothetical protein [Sphingobacterium]MBA8988426.1 hypothetical protein [Sphingobacterium soli]OYD43332.1 hypothetical protein CHT99_05845 [Sphingobacterium cellulitidis]OYD47331.1 hypothetical protein CHU00_00155 [Sphingobacterium cellulitidis]WFB62728.1 hypothetical protein PZ892_13720 [Sphingobacterium sp. WM]GGE32891.1 hypothetical protein GCM10011516_33260 [Sphingobacterium soli]